MLKIGTPRVIMHFFVYSRQAIEAIAPHDDAEHLIISIRTPGDPKEVRLPICAQTLGVLRMEFHDLDRIPVHPIPLLLLGVSESLAEGARVLGVDQAHLFSEVMGKQVLDFVRPHIGKTKRIIAHCDAGWSRSPAIAAGLAKTLFSQDDSEFFKRYTPNMLVYRSIINAFNQEL